MRFAVSAVVQKALEVQDIGGGKCAGLLGAYLKIDFTAGMYIDYSEGMFGDREHRLTVDSAGPSGFHSCSQTSRKLVHC